MHICNIVSFQEEFVEQLAHFVKDLLLFILAYIKFKITIISLLLYKHR